MATTSSEVPVPTLPVVHPSQAQPSPWFDRVETYKTGEEHGQSLKFSPFDANRIACSTGGDYGLGGEGHIFVLERDPSNNGQMKEVLVADYRDNLLDICWSESDPNILATAAGDGFAQVWNLGTRFPKVPVHEFKGHQKEMSSVEWSPGKFGNILLAASWDGTVCCYDMSGPWPLHKMVASDIIVYQASWSPHTPYTFCCVSQDGILQLWDMQASATKAQIYLSVTETELLACDWAKYSENIIATAGSDCSVKGWDLRNYSQPLFHVMDHGHAVRRVKFSPYHPTTFASVSYDMSLRIFDYHISDENLEIIADHTEFVYGLDWNLHYKNEIATCAWDKTIQIRTPKCLIGT